MRPCSLRSLCCVAVLVTTTAALAPAGTQHSYLEDFTTTTYKDPALTTAEWDTVAGRLELAPFALESIGSYDTPDNAVDVVVTGDLAFVADAIAGLLIFDISDPSTPSLLGTYLTAGNAQGVWVAGDVAYVADHNAGIQIIDVTNPSSPSLLGSYNTGGTAYDVEVHGGLAFVADYGAGLVVLNVSNPAAPSLVSALVTPGNARSIDVEGDHAYIADRGVGGLQIIDISDPSAPAAAGSHVPGGDVLGVTVSGNVAYIGAGAVGLVAVDVTDPTNPVPLGTLTLSSARRLDVEGDFAYVAGYFDVHAVDISDPSNLVLLDSYTTPGIASDAAVSGEHVYVADGAAGGLQVYRCAFPVWPIDAGSYNTPRLSRGLAVSGNHAFVADELAGLQVIDITNPTAPTLAGVYDTGSEATRVCVSGDYAYVADYADGMRIIDISDPTAPVHVGFYDSTFATYDVDVSGDYAYMANDLNGLLVIDISNPASPSRMSAFDTPGYARGVQVVGNYAFVADGFNGVQIIDISNPVSPAWIGSYNTPDFAVAVYVAGDHAYVADTAGGLQIVDISDPSTPTLAGVYDTPHDALGVHVSGNHAFVANSSWGLFVFDVSDPATPTLVGRLDSGNAMGVEVAGDYAFLADGSVGLKVMQVFQRELDEKNNQGFSSIVGASSGSVARIRLTTAHADSVDWLVSINGGTSYWPVEPDGRWLDLSYAVGGGGVAWWSKHGWSAPGVNPAVDWLRIDWLFHYAVIDSVVDIPNDQGRQVSIHWTRSGHDFVGFSSQTTEYTIYRRIDPLLASPPLKPAGDDPALAWPPGDWHYVTTVPAHAEETYAAVVPTLADSTIDEGMYRSTFFIRAMTATPGIHGDSPPDSGYSVDNLDPAVPQGLAVAYNSGSGTDLMWLECPDADFQYFKVYRGDTQDFVPGAGNLVHMTTQPAWQDPIAQGYGYVYKVSAVDFSGNESDAAVAGLVTGIGVSPAPERFALYQNVPNPFNPSTLIRFDVPASGGRVTLRVFDVSGRLVRTLVDRVESPGVRSVAWDGRNQRGAYATTGVYFYRLEAPGYQRTLKMVLLK